MKTIVFAFALLGLLACNAGKHNNVETFWTDFQQAVAANDKASVANMTLFPLPGSNVFGADIAENGMTREQFLNYYDQIFEEKIKETIASTSANELNEYVPPKDAALESLHLPASTTVYSFAVHYIFNEGFEAQTESVITFYFLKHEGDIKLAYILVVG